MLEPTNAKYFLLRNEVLAQRVQWAGRIPALAAPAGHSVQPSQEDTATDAVPSLMMGVSKLPDGAQLEHTARQGCAWQPTPDTFLHDWKSATEVEEILLYKVYKRAALHGTEIVHAGTYQQSDKPSCFCLVSYTEAQRDGQDKTTFYAAHIKWFVNVTLLLSQQPNGLLSTQHFAIADLLPLEPIEDYGGARYRHKLRCASRNATPQFVPNIPYAMYPVGLEELKRKLVWCPLS